MYVGDIAGFVKNMGTTIYGMTAQYWKSVVVGLENRLASSGFTLPQMFLKNISNCCLAWRLRR
jgi:hypothetical protein